MMMQITAEELGKALSSEQPPKVIDVRESYEYKRSHIRGAISLPVRALASKIKSTVRNAAERIILYSDRGIESHHAARLLRAMGYYNVAEVSGGLFSVQHRPGGSSLMANA
jgi:rhodanese-related sulfurtransferase